MPALLDFIAPRHCSVCGKRLAVGEKALCLSCLLDLNVAELAKGAAGNALERTLWGKAPIMHAAAFMVYDSHSAQRQLVLDLKYHNRHRIGYHLGELMSRSLMEQHFFDGIDAVVPIPIPVVKRLRRGYNQSEHIAQGISKATGIRVDTRIIRRRPYRISQTRLSSFERVQNVKDTFFLHRADNLQGKHLLIVDDVITTTATVRECARTLAAIPNVKISVLALAVSKNLIANIRKSNPEEETNTQLLFTDTKESKNNN